MAQTIAATTATPPAPMNSGVEQLERPWPDGRTHLVLEPVGTLDATPGHPGRASADPFPAELDALAAAYSEPYPPAAKA